jgi:hypothetical protein
VQYFFEIALDPEHFRWAYELGSLGDSLISQSGWQDTNFYQDASGWGAFEVDTTWFRVKARKLPGWESGWSSTVYYTEGGSGASLTDVKDLQEDIPTVFKVEQNYPNPFNANTIIAFQLPEPGDIEITVFNLRGSRVRTLLKQTRQAGHYTAIWDGKDDFGRSTASGIYIITVFAEMRDGRILHDRIKIIQIK